MVDRLRRGRRGWRGLRIDCARGCRDAKRAGSSQQGRRLADFHGNPWGQKSENWTGRKYLRTRGFTSKKSLPSTIVSAAYGFDHRALQTRKQDFANRSPDGRASLSRCALYCPVPQRRTRMPVSLRPPLGNSVAEAFGIVKPPSLTSAPTARRRCRFRHYRTIGPPKTCESTPTGTQDIPRPADEASIRMAPDMASSVLCAARPTVAGMPVDRWVTSEQAEPSP